MKKPIFGGMCIAIGAATFLVSGIPLLFTLGIFLVAAFGLGLITGYVPYSKFKKKLQVKQVMIILIGNLIGAAATGFLIRYTPIHNKIITKATEIVAIKASLSPWAIIASGVVTGILIGCAVIIYNESEDEIIGWFGLLFCTVAFVYLGTEHVVANAFYLALSPVDLCSILKIIVYSTIGNFVGGWVLGGSIDI